MSRFILDTGAVVGYLKSAPFAAVIERDYAPFAAPNLAAICVVTRGELISLSYQRGWGEAKRDVLNQFLKKIPHIGIDKDEIMERYGEIDAFSQGKLKGKSLGTSARNMGKNDLWIAAVASVARAALITTDKDFHHLDPHYLSLVFVDPKSTP